MLDTFPSRHRTVVDVPLSPGVENRGGFVAAALA